MKKIGLIVILISSCKDIDHEGPENSDENSIERSAILNKDKNLLRNVVIKHFSYPESSCDNALEALAMASYEQGAGFGLIVEETASLKMENSTILIPQGNYTIHDLLDTIAEKADVEWRNEIPGKIRFFSK